MNLLKSIFISVVFLTMSCTPELNDSYQKTHTDNLEVSVPPNTMHPKIFFSLGSNILQLTNDRRPILSTNPSQQILLRGGFNPYESKWYANNLFYERRVYFPDTIAWIQPTIVYFKTEPGRDFLEIRHINNDQINNTWKYTGAYRDNSKLKPISMSNNGRNFLSFIFKTNKRIGHRGWLLDNFEYITLDIEQNSIHPIKTNHSVDGFLTKTSDVIYFKADYNPNNKHIVHLDHIKSSTDVKFDHYNFDVYIKVSNSEERPSANDFDFSGEATTFTKSAKSTKNNPLNEVVEIPKDLNGSTIWIAVKSKKNDGQFRLAVNKIAYEVTATVGVGGWNAGIGDHTWNEIVPPIANLTDFFAELSRLTYASTDGTILVNRYEIRAGNNCCNGINCTLYCKLQLLKNQIPAGRRAEFPYHIWLETQNRSISAIARTFAHEMGHDYYMQLNYPDPFLVDEYYNDTDHSFNNPVYNKKQGSGHTIMIGSGGSRDLNVIDLSTSNNYNKDPYCYPEYTFDSTTSKIVSTGTGHLGCVPVSQLEYSNWRLMNTILNIDYPYYIMKGRQPDPHKYQSSYPCSIKDKFVKNTHSSIISFKKLIEVEIYNSKIYPNETSGSASTRSGLYRYDSDKCNQGLIGVPR